MSSDLLNTTEANMCDIDGNNLLKIMAGCSAGLFLFIRFPTLLALVVLIYILLMPYIFDQPFSGIKREITDKNLKEVINLDSISDEDFFEDLNVKENLNVKEKS